MYKDTSSDLKLSEMFFEKQIFNGLLNTKMAATVLGVLSKTWKSNEIQNRDVICDPFNERGLIWL